MNKPLDAFFTRRGLLGRAATLAVSVAGAGVLTRLQPAQAAPWNSAMQLLVSVEINKADGGRYHRPFVAVWIEDANGKPVRTLSLWGQTAKRGPKWIGVRFSGIGAVRNQRSHVDRPDVATLGVWPQIGVSGVRCRRRGRRRGA